MSALCVIAVEIYPAKKVEKNIYINWLEFNQLVYFVIEISYFLAQTAREQHSG